VDTAIAVALIGVGTTVGAAGGSMINDWASDKRDHRRWLRERRYEAAVDFVAACRAVRWNDPESWARAVRRGDELSIVSPRGMRPLVSTLLIAAENVRMTEGAKGFESTRERYDEAIDLFLEAAQPLITRGNRSRRLYRSIDRRRARLHSTTAGVLTDRQAIADVGARLDAITERLKQLDGPTGEHPG
jgi:hypothetical protein